MFQLHLPDVVITDMNMPDMSGVQMARTIRAINPTTKLIVLTGDSGPISPGAPSAGERFATGHYLTKPVSFGLFFTAIEQCLGERYPRQK